MQSISFNRLAFLFCVLVMSFFLNIQPSFATTLTVDAQSNIYGAGHSTMPDYGLSHTGILPPSYSFTAKPNQVLTFSNVTGSVTYNGGGNWYGPENWYGIGNKTDIFAVAGISGTFNNDRRFHLVGVFLDDTEPSGTAPGTLIFGSTGINDDFLELSPMLNQTFFIGDGLTGTGTGVMQSFYIPATATRLYLGFADGYDFAGLPYLYSDNYGSLNVEFAITATPIPEPSSMLLLGGGLAGMAWLKKRYKYR